MSRSHPKPAAVVALAAVACCLATVAAAARASDGGGGTYRAAGSDYDFALVNTGTTAWRSFYVVAPTGINFVGGTTGNEASATCVVGPPNRIECGSLPPSLMPPQGRIAFVATTRSTATCDSTFTLFVSSSDAGAYVDAGNIMAAAGCSLQSPHALTKPVLRGVARVGRTLRVVPPRWSAQPSRVNYRYERCTVARCAPIAHAVMPWLHLTARDAGRLISVIVTATIDGVEVHARSRPVRVVA